jgi:hypothetical protein
VEEEPEDSSLIPLNHNTSSRFSGSPDGQACYWDVADCVVFGVRDRDKGVDLRLTKHVAITGSNKIAIFAEAFNVFNWVNYSNYFTIMNQKDKAGVLIFGTPNNAYAARQVQIGARVMF